MSVFGNILKKVFNRDNDDAAPKAPSAKPATTPSATPTSTTTPVQPVPSSISDATAATPGEVAQVDVGAVLDAMAAMKPHNGGNYRSSIVDLLKLLDLDSSIDARKELAEELNVSEGAHGSAPQNMALHRAVMNKLEENGGVVPDSLRQ